MAAQQATTAPIAAWHELQVQLGRTSVVFPDNPNLNGSLLNKLDPIRMAKRSGNANTYPFISLNNLRHLGEAFVVYPVYTTEMANSITGS